MLPTPATPLGPQYHADSFPLVRNSWSVTQAENICEVAYGSERHSPQYGALHCESGFLRVNSGPGSSWGTSIILLPSLWVAGKYYQGAAIDLRCRPHGSDLLILFRGAIASLEVLGRIVLTPPRTHSLSGWVAVNVTGTAELDCRPGEAFKPVMLSSMHVSMDEWDTHCATIHDQIFGMPADGWVFPRPIVASRFALNGGNSRMKKQAPTIEIRMDERRDVLGWKKASLDPDDDNVGLWAASDNVLKSWQYEFRATLNR